MFRIVAPLEVMAEMDRKNDKLAEDFLLGKLSEDERGDFEERFVTDRHAFDQLLLAETELIDDFVAGRLRPEDRTRFEDALRANPRQREKVAFSRALASYSANVGIPPASTASSGWRRWFSAASFRPAIALAAAAIVIAVGAVLWMSRGENVEIASEAPPSNEDHAIRAGETPQLPLNTGATNGAVRSESAPPEPRVPKIERTSAPVVSTLILSTGVTRSGGDSHPSIKEQKSGIIRLQLRPHAEQSEFSGFVVVVETVSGEPIWNGRVRAGRRGISANVPATRLRRGDYIVTLKGTRGSIAETVDEFAFSVTP